MFMFLSLSFLAALMFRWIAGGSPSLTAIYASTGLLWCAYGLSTVAIYTTSMDIVRKGREGTDFTIQIVITHLSSLIIAVMSGKLGDLLGYKRFFNVEIILCAFTFLILFYALGKKDINEYSR